MEGRELGMQTEASADLFREYATNREATVH